MMDTDGDGVTDLGEVAFDTDPTDPTSTMDPDDFFVILPYNGDHVHDNLTFGTNLQVADVYFLIDTTGSMDPAIENVATSLASVIVPGIRAAIPDVQMGVGHFNDVPDGISSLGTYVPHGTEPDEPYWNVQNITADDTAVQDGLTYLYGPDFPWGGGGDTHESAVIALWSTATGNGFDECNSSVPPQVCPEIPDEMSPRRGYPCFRPESLPIIVNISDSSWHNNELGGYAYECTDTDFDDALTELNDIGARYIGVFVDHFGSDFMIDSYGAMASGTGTVDATGEPLVEKAVFGRVSETIVDLIATLATSTPQDVNAVPQDEPDDPPGANYDATVFIKNITPLHGYPDSPEGFSTMDSTRSRHWTRPRSSRPGSSCSETTSPASTAARSSSSFPPTACATSSSDHSRSRHHARRTSRSADGHDMDIAPRYIHNSHVQAMSPTPMTRALPLLLVLLAAGCGKGSNNGADADADSGDPGIDSVVTDTESDDAGLSDTASDEVTTGYHRVIAIGDNHADLDQTLAALRTGGVIDSELDWTGGDTIVVQTGDIMDRGVEEKEVIDLYETLRPLARAAGGDIINMNGNHEIMTAYADYRYVMEAACLPFMEISGLDLTNPAFDGLSDACKHRAAAFWPGGPYAQIIAEWPMIVVLQDSVFVHGGLHQKHLDYGIDAINSMTNLFLLGSIPLDYSMVGGGDDCVDWDRTYSDDEVSPTPTDCANLESVLTELGVTRLVVGHTVQSTISTSCDGLAYLIDVGMAEYYGGSVQVLEITPDGETNAL